MTATNRVGPARSPLRTATSSDGTPPRRHTGRDQPGGHIRTMAFITSSRQLDHEGNEG